LCRPPPRHPCGENTKYDEGIKAGYVAFVNAGLKAGKYKASDIIRNDETNVDLDLVSGTTLVTLTMLIVHIEILLHTRDSGRFGCP
jgi:hypothetical protein